MNAALIVLVLSAAIAHPAAGQCLRSRVKNIETSYNNNEPFNRFHRRALAEIRAAFIDPNRNPFNNPSLRSKMYRYLLAYVLVRRDGSLPLAVKRLVVYDKLGTKIASVDYNIGLDHEMSPTYELADRNAMEDVLRYCKEDELLPSSIERYLHAHRSEAGERLSLSDIIGQDASQQQGYSKVEQGASKRNAGQLPSTEEYTNCRLAYPKDNDEKQNTKTPPRQLDILCELIGNFNTSVVFPTNLAGSVASPNRITYKSYTRGTSTLPFKPHSSHGEAAKRRMYRVRRVEDVRTMGKIDTTARYVSHKWKQQKNDKPVY